METYVALFKGVNVGGKNILSMKELISTLEENGYQNVKTYIQSGNVIFKGKDFSADDIVKLVSNKFGFNPKVLILNASEFLSTIKLNPFHPIEGKSAHFYFCSTKPKVNSEKLREYLAETEEYKLIDRVFYLLAPNGIGRSKLVANIELCLGVPVSGRNLNTIKKIEEMVKKA